MFKVKKIGVKQYSRSVMKTFQKIIGHDRTVGNDVYVDPFLGCQNGKD